MFRVAWPAAVPVTPGAGEARDWARRELARREYVDARPGWFELLRDAVARWFRSLGSSGGGVDLLVLGLVLAGVIAAVVLALLVAGRPRLARRGPRPVFDGPRPWGPDDYRAAAGRAAAAGDWSAAVTHRFRALAATVAGVDDRAAGPGATAQEVAVAAAALPGAGPDLAAGLVAAADLFDAVTYGGRTADEAAYTRLVGLDAEVSARVSAAGRGVPSGAGGTR